ncbi:nitroreductase [Prescottella agglutinans]|uniref:Nitroreductase n=2 Tax=Prescottella agglutinans TaxID=1644129 RepID=A0ABT6M9X3_9NOCA|nr:nitroreductase [Prescottella agglutinans]
MAEGTTALVAVSGGDQTWWMVAGPGIEDIRAAVVTACRAPSLHNSQPWRWRMVDGRLQLHTDPARAVPVADPLGRQMVISCGTALHHFEVAVTRYEVGAVVERLPDPDDPMYLASITFAPLSASRVAASEESVVAMRRAIDRRRTDRRPFGEPPSRDLRGLGDDMVEQFAVSLTMLGNNGPSRLAEAARCSASVRRYDPAYHAELYWWAGHAPADVGIPDTALPLEGAVPVGREFPIGTLTSPSSGRDQAALAVIGTDADTRLDWLRSGQALSHLLLTATARGMATCPVTHLTEVAASRRIVREAAAAGGAGHRFPQVVVRLGASPGGTLPLTGRRPVDEVWTA